MYTDHVPQIAAHAKASPEGLADVCVFVLATIRVQFGRVPAGMREIRQRRHLASALWGWKREGYEFIRDNRDDLFAGAQALDDPETTCELIDLFASQVPGLGIVKAAFVVQMLGHDVACFDSRNLEVLGYATNARPWRNKKIGKQVNRLRKISDYVQATRASGGSAFWWDHWCAGIAPALGITPDAVSGWHLTEVKKGSGIK